jgi:hypothetical protein
VAILPIYFGDPESSLKATMIFPREPDKAALFAAWLIMRRIGKEREEGAGRVYELALAIESNRPDFLQICCAAAQFADIYAEAQQNFQDSIVAGIITAVLDSMICDDHENQTNIASWKNAVDVTKKLVVSIKFRERRRLKANRSQYAECLTRFAPVLHLLAARTMRRQDEGDGLDRIVDLMSDPAVNYRRQDDLLFFVFEAKQLQLELGLWDHGWNTNRVQRSNYLREMFEFDGTWTPPVRQPGWPETAGRLKRLRLDEGMKPAPKKVGRPKK